VNLDQCREWIRQHKADSDEDAARALLALLASKVPSRDEWEALRAERNRLATDSGIKSLILEQVANGAIAPTRDAIQARHDQLWVEATKK
jgi:hypothetical protein